MKGIAFWEEKLRKAQEMDAEKWWQYKPDPPLLRGRRRKPRHRIWSRYQGQIVKYRHAVFKRQQMEARIKFYEARIAALRSRTAFDHLRRGGLEI